MQQFVVPENKHGACACLSIMLVIAGFVGMVVCFSNIDFTDLHQSLKPTTENELDDGYLMEEYEQFMKVHGRSYLTKEEKNMRFQIFAQNVQEIRELQNSGIISHKLSVNQFADMTKEEFKNFVGLNQVRDDPVCASKHASDSNKADIDWIAKGAVAKVKNQASCGSCYTFSAVAAIEGLYQISGHALTMFSEQELVDCKYEGNDGCNGGWMDACFDYVMKYGIASGTDYPYTGRDGKCKNATTTRY